MLLKPKTDFIRSLYLGEKLSQRQIVRKLGGHKYIVEKVCRLIARDKSTAARLRVPEIPICSLSDRACRNRARKQMERHLGRKLSRLEVVHHRDKNVHNDCLDNLEIMSASEHTRFHVYKGRDPQQVKREKREYVKRFIAAKRYPAICLNCHKDYLKDFYHPSDYCSRSCAISVWWRERRHD